jgi:hypothetical protein
MGLGQINIDLIFGYLAFIVFVWYFSGYVGDLFTPFMDYAGFESIEKSALLQRNKVASVINIDNIKDVCNISVADVYGSSISYLIKGFNVFEKDEDFTYPNETDGGVVIVRDHSSFTIMAGTNSTSFEKEYNATIVFTLPFTIVRVDELSTSPPDYYNQSIDDYGNLVFEVGLSTNITDKFSGYVFHTGFKTDKFMVVEDFTNDYSTLFVGDVKAEDFCFSGAESEKVTYYNFFKRIGYGDNEFYGLISATTWWLDE